MKIARNPAGLSCPVDHDSYYPIYRGTASELLPVGATLIRDFPQNLPLFQFCFVFDNVLKKNSAFLCQIPAGIAELMAGLWGFIKAFRRRRLSVVGIQMLIQK